MTVKRAIISAMVAMLVVSSPMTAMASGLDNHGTSSAPVSANSAEYNNTETSGNSDAAQMLQDSQTAKTEAADAVSAAAQAAGNADQATEASAAAVKDAQSAKTQAASASQAAAAAQSAVDKAQTAADDVKRDVAAANDQADKAESAAENAENAADDANKAVAAVNATDGTESSQEKLNELKENADTYNKEVEADQQAVDEKILSAENDADQNGKNDAVEAVNANLQEAKDLQKQALAALESTVNSDGQERKDNAQAVADIAVKAQAVYKDATDNLSSAQSRLAAAVAEYNRQAMTYGLPLYGEKTVTYTAEDIEKAGLTQEKATVEDTQKKVNLENADIQDDSIDASKETVAKAEKDLSDATGAYQQAVTAATGALDTVRKITDDKDTQSAVSQAKSAIDSANDAIEAAADTKNKAAETDTKAAVTKTQAETAQKEATDAVTAADDTINHYIDQAQDALDRTNAEIADNTKQVAVAQANYDAAVSAATAQKQAAQSAYDNAKKDITDNATAQYTRELEAKSTAVTDAQTAYDNSAWKVKIMFVTVTFHDAEAERNLKDAHKAYDAFNKESVKQSYIDNALNGSDQYKALQNAERNLNDTVNDSEGKRVLDELKKTGASLADTASQQQNQVADAKAAAEKANTDYLNAVKAADDEARQQMLAAIEAQMAKDSNSINQTEYDKALYDWAEKADLPKLVAFWTDEHKDADKLRRYMNDRYDEKTVRAALDWLGITQWIVGKKNVSNNMQAVIDCYRDSLKQAEEKKADTIAAIAKSDAETARQTAANAGVKADTAKDTAATAAKNAATSAADAENAKKTAADAEENAKNLVKDTQNTYDTIKKLQNAEGTSYEQIASNASGQVKDAEEQLNKIKKDATVYSQLSAVDLKELFNAIADAQKAVDSAKKAVAQVKNLNNKVTAYSGYATAYAGYADGKAQTATAYAEISKDENGNIIYLTESDVDLTDAGVSSRASANYVSASKTNGVAVPESVFKAYLDSVIRYENGDKTGTNYSKNGTGISAGGSMPIVYWAVDENGQLTGTYYTSSSQLAPSTRYFVGTAYKHESGGYHMDGVYLTTAAAAAVPEAQEETAVTAVTTSTVSDTTVSSAATTAIAQTQTPLAATPAVLGARRVQDAGNAAVSTAAAEQPEVLGAVRTRATGDETHDGMRAVIALAGLSAAGLLIAAGRRKKKNEEKA